MVQLNIPDKLYVRLYAGMGDFYKRYFCHSTWQCLEDLKMKHPEVSIHALCVSQTIPALELVDYHPCIDKVIKPKIHLREFKQLDVTKYIGEYQFLNPGIAKRFEQNITPIYMSKEDEEFVDNVKTKYGDYICIHPFAGDTYGLNTRTPLKVKEYIPIINALVDSGYNVIMLGKSWKRIVQGTDGKTKTIQETFDWTRPGFINMIDKTNVRTGAALVKNSSGFVGTASSFMCAAWSMGGIKTSIITSMKWKQPLEEAPWAKDKIGNPNHQMIYLNNGRSANKLKEIADVTANWF